MPDGKPADPAEDIRHYFIKQDAALDAKCGELGIEKALRTVPGVNMPMLLAFGENGIKTIEDLAACATDDLWGWAEYKKRRIKRHLGILEGIALSRNECDALILHARLIIGWI